MSENQNPNLTLILSAQDINVIHTVLQEMPYKISKPLLDKIIPQIEKQQESVEDSEEAASEPTIN